MLPFSLQSTISGNCIGLAPMCDREESATVNALEDVVLRYGRLQECRSTSNTEEKRCRTGGATIAESPDRRVNESPGVTERAKITGQLELFGCATWPAAKPAPLGRQTTGGCSRASSVRMVCAAILNDTHCRAAELTPSRSHSRSSPLSSVVAAGATRRRASAQLASRESLVASQMQVAGVAPRCIGAVHRVCPGVVVGWR